MDSYDEVHDVKDGRDITTPDLDVSSAIKFVRDEDDDEEFVKNSQNVSDEVKLGLDGVFHTLYTLDNFSHRFLGFHKAKT